MLLHSQVVRFVMFFAKVLFIGNAVEHGGDEATFGGAGVFWRFLDYLVLDSETGLHHVLQADLLIIQDFVDVVPALPAL